MTLAKRVVANAAALGLGLVVACAAVVVGFVTLQQVVTSTHEEFHELCDLRAVSALVTKAERSLSADDRALARAALAQAAATLERFDRFQREGPTEFGPEHARDEEHSAEEVLAALAAVRAELDGSAGERAGPSAQATLAHAADRLDALMTRIEQSVADVHSRTAERFNKTLGLIVAIEGASLFVVAGISVLLYRSVVMPLRLLRDATNRLAEGQRDTRLQTTGDREFVELQVAFNRMAAELQSLCDDLERRVAEKSKKLVLAERLASVGYLAAGVAHEINNPLAIMSGYAESLLRTANRDGGRDHAELVRDLETIRDEAFRCKRITQSLLDLSRLGDDHREPVPLGSVVESCARLTAAWPASRSIKFELDESSCPGVKVMASEPELRQVVLNLLVNAVEAITPSDGTVSMAITCHDEWVELAVRDDGKGMAPETLSRIFEPFYTSGKGQSGLGLGLSISHAIARRHGGALEASSPGVGLGSTLLLRLPALVEEKT